MPFGAPKSLGQAQMVFGKFFTKLWGNTIVFPKPLKAFGPK